MSRGGDTRFEKGRSGNPGGRPRRRRPDVSAFDVIFDKTLTVMQGGTERELTVEEALQLQTYQSALKGSRLAIRQILRMIEKREVALAARNPTPSQPFTLVHTYDADNASQAVRILGIADDDPAWAGLAAEGKRMKVTTWAAQAALSRPGRRKFTEEDVEDIKRFTFDAEKLRWPRERIR